MASEMRQPPTGTVTFLFTDIEGSTRLWEDHRQEMEAALEHHDEILRSAIRARNGYVFSTGGDGFAAAFSRVQDAIDAAIVAQSQLVGTAWPEQMSIQVRMGGARGRGPGTGRGLLVSAR